MVFHRFPKTNYISRPDSMTGFFRKMIYEIDMSRRHALT